MKMTFRMSRALCLVAATAFAALLFVSPAASQPLARRLSVAPTASAARVSLPGTVSGHIAESTLLGHLSGDVQLTGMSIALKPTAAQGAALDQLLADQQDPSSSRFHQWLTPEEFGLRFGLPDEDLAVVKTWLQARGFTVDSVAPSRNRIVFTGTAANVESTFGTTLQRYQLGDQTFFENSTEAQIPAVLAEVIGGISGLSSYRLEAPLAKHLPKPLSQASPLYTTSSGKTQYLVPWDVRQIFGTNTLISSGYDGTGIKIGVIGQSAVSTTQLTYFQQKTGQAVKLPTMMLVPNTGVSNAISGDEGESELDLEYASGSAPGATVLFIYTGCGTTSSSTTLTSRSCGNVGVFDSLAYAVTYNLAPILTFSYGACEAKLSLTGVSSVEAVLKQANAQGQTFLASSGDTGAACESSSTTVATGGLSVSYPASSVYATGVGGTQLNGSSSSYWSTTNNSFAGSAFGYIPEIAWNDTVLGYGASAATGNVATLAQSGGGASGLFTKPSWQVGRGIPADGKRDVPDVSLPASVSVNGYIVCPGDPTYGATAACSDSTIGFITGGGGLIGGTSAAAPNLAAILAIIEQANGGGALGNVNPNLCALAAGGASTSVFHDITSGNNIVRCQGGTTGCSSTASGTNGTMGYTTGTGYDQVTGLGSVNATALRAGLNPSRLSSTVTLTLSTVTPAVNTAVTFTAKVAGSGATPTGAVVFSVDGTPVGSAVPLASGTAAYSILGFNTTGSHTVSAAYTGDLTYAGSTASSTATATAGKTASWVNITVPNTALAVNTAVVFNAQVTPGATGTVIFSVDGIQVGPAVTLVSWSGSYTYSGFSTAGPHTVLATYSGDSTLDGSSTSSVFTVGTGKLTSSAFMIVPSGITTNSTVRLSASFSGPSVSQVVGGSGLTGTATFSIDGKAVSTAIPLDYIGGVSYVFNGFITGGTHTISVSYSGDATYSPVSTSVTVAVASILNTTSVYVSVSASTPTVGVATNLAAAVVAASNNTPTGTVQFSVDGSVVSSAIALAAVPGASSPSGSATIPYTFTSGGAHTVVAAYSGDALYSAQSGTTTVTASTPVVGGISLGTTPSTLTVAYGSPGQVTVTVLSVNNYVGPVSIVPSITVVSGASFVGCYSVSSTPNPPANGTATTTLTLTATSGPCPAPASRNVVVAGIAKNVPPESGGRSRAELAIAAAALLGLVGLRRRTLASRLLLFCAAAGLAVGLGGCSGIDVISILKKQRQVVEGFTMKIDGEREQGKEPSLWETVHIDFELKGNIDPDKAYRACALSIDKYCSVAETLRRGGTKITWKVQVVPG